MISTELLEQELKLLQSIADKLDKIISQLDTGKTRPVADHLYTFEEAAALLNVSRSWIYHATHCNKIPYCKIGKYVRFKTSDLEEIMR